jgi:hypothetical protein
MQLALAAGRPDLGAFSRGLTERDFQAWMRFASARGLPFHRLELYLAQIALMIVRVAGVEADLSDFLFDFDKSAPADPLEEAMEALEFSPRKVKGK